MDNMKHRVVNSSKIINLFIDAGKCLKFSMMKESFTPEVDKCAEDVLKVVQKLVEQPALKQLKERVKHLKKLIHM
jgi:hypothetical protein